ncbi:hypothetical protein Lser_V15G31892 [Lactuca serriola]
MEKRDDDGISALSDCLLLEILSRLPSTKDAIRTGTLSKRWEHLWTWVPTLIFSTTNRPPTQRLQNSKSRAEFALLVDKTITQCHQIKLKKFKVHTYYDTRIESQFNNWIRYVISCKVKELNLEFWGRETEFLLNEFIFINSRFTYLRLTGCKLNPSGAISWENLRSLCISGVNVDEDLIVNIVSGSPLLETLVFEYCRWLNITSESESEAGDIIRKCVPTSLSLTQCRQLKLLKKFKLYADYDIQFQSQLNNLILYAIRCNVEDLNLRFWNHAYDDEFVLDQIVFTTSCFNELRVGGCMLNPVAGISWKSLRSLCISEHIRLDEDLIENILSGSPVLETLELDDCYGFRRLNITSRVLKAWCYVDMRFLIVDLKSI